MESSPACKLRSLQLPTKVLVLSVEKPSKLSMFKHASKCSRLALQLVCIFLYIRQRCFKFLLLPTKKNFFLSPLLVIGVMLSSHCSCCGRRAGMMFCVSSFSDGQLIIGSLATNLLSKFKAKINEATVTDSRLKKISRRDEIPC